MGGANVEPLPPCSIGAPQSLTININNDIESISMVWNGSEYAALYRDFIAGKMGIYLSRWSKAGIQQGSAQMILESPNPQVQGDFFVTTVWNGTGYGILFSRQGSGGWTFYFASYDAQGNQLSAPVKIANNSVEAHALVWTGKEYGIVWIAAFDVWFGRVSAAGAIVGTPTKLGPAAISYKARDVSVTWSGNEYGIVWQDDTTVYFTRVNADGNELISDVALGPSDNDGGPQVVWGKGEYVAGWVAPGATMNDGSRVLVRRISENGTLQGNPVEVKNIGSMMPSVRILPHLDVAYNGTSYAVSWVSNEVNPKGFEVYMARFDAALQKLGSDVQVTTYGPRDAVNIYEAGNFPRLVWNGEEYAVTWHDLAGQPTGWKALMRSVCY